MEIKPPFVDVDRPARGRVKESCGCDFKYIKVGKLSFIPTNSEEEKKKGIFSWEIVVKKT